MRRKNADFQRKLCPSKYKDDRLEIKLDVGNIMICNLFDVAYLFT